MTVQVKLGRKPAVIDARVPFLHEVVDLSVLPAAPAEVNWYAGVEETTNGWQMLGNDTVGDCVQAAAMHLLQSMSNYAGRPLVPTKAETLQAYSESTGYVPGDPSTDQGTVVLGPGGFMEYWLKTGLPIAGGRNKIAGFVQIKPEHLDIAVHLFGGALRGINLPANVVAGNTVPYGWGDPKGPVAGGHEVVELGYFLIGADRASPIISWGERYQGTQAFMTAVTEEICCVVDPAAMNARGVNADGINLAAISNAMDALRATA